MNRKDLLLWVLVVLLIYPAVSLYQAGQALEVETNAGRAEAAIRSYQLSIWLTWLVMVSVAVYYKWSLGKNFFFYFTYIFLLLVSGVYGYFIQEMVLNFDLPSTFRDNYTLGVLAALQNFLVGAVITGFLQAGVWWFTRRWHRR